MLQQFFAISLLGTLTASALTWKGADFSSVALAEKAGIRYKDTTGTSLAFRIILKHHGMNTARVRIWTAGDYNTVQGLALGKACPRIFTFVSFP